MFRHIYQLKKLKNQGGLKWCFYVSYTMYVRTISFSNYHCHYHYQNHYHFKLTSTDIVSVKHCDLQNNWRDGVSSRIYIRSSPPLLFLSNVNGALNPSILNWAKEMSHQVLFQKSKEYLCFCQLYFPKNQIYFLVNWYLKVHLHYNFLTIFLIIGKSGFM